ncbi:hypothetical protein C8Q79DRAFT_903069 [Trametes meyenii]|nr:hypothetical protein C8Q79DRAFT_903069 [Trametes meyenii]
MHTDSRLHTNALRSDRILPALHADDISRTLAAANPHALLVPALPHIPRHPNPKPTPRRSSRRPSTASSAEDKHNLLPPVSSMGDLSPSAYIPEVSDTPGLGSKVRSLHTRDQDPASALYSDSAIEEVNRRANAAVAGLRAEASRLQGIGEFLISP